MGMQILVILSLHMGIDVDLNQNLCDSDAEAWFGDNDLVGESQIEVDRPPQTGGGSERPHITAFHRKPTGKLR